MVRGSFKHFGSITINLDRPENGKLHSDLSQAYCSQQEKLESKVLDLINMEDEDNEDDLDEFFEDK